VKIIAVVWPYRKNIEKKDSEKGIKIKIQGKRCMG
jgi:hypothetical protein